MPLIAPKLQFEIQPHSGIGPFLLGESITVVRERLASLGFPVKFHENGLDYYFDASVQVEYDDDQTISFIGVSFDDRYDLRYFGLNVFDTPASELFDYIASIDKSGEHQFTTIQYCFPSQIITLWSADTQYDRLQNEKRVVWAQVGIGNLAYVKAIKEIRSRHA